MALAYGRGRIGRHPVYTLAVWQIETPQRFSSAEDDDALRSLLTAILRREGYQVLEAADGIRVVRLLAEQDVDALLLDIRLGVDDGIALGHELRLERPHLPIALMSGDSSADARERAVGLTDHFLEKPFTLLGVKAMVEKLLGQSR